MANKSKYESVLCKIAGHNENDLTRMLAVVLNYNKSSLKRLLEHVKLPDYELIDDVLISTQFRDISYLNDSENVGGIFDLEINLKNCFKIIIEAKLQSRPDNLEQLERYANKLKEEKDNEKFPIVKLIFLTKYNEEMKYNALKSKNILSENEDLIYKISNSNDHFFVINSIGGKKDTLISDFKEFLSDDICHTTLISWELKNGLLKEIVNQIESGNHPKMTSSLFFKFGEWATFQSNYQACRGKIASRIMLNLLGFHLSRKDISFKTSGGYFPLETGKIFENLWLQVSKNRLNLIEAFDDR